MGKKSGGPYTPIRPAFAFLVTPKLPLSGRSVKIYGVNKYRGPTLRQIKFSKSPMFLSKHLNQSS